MAKVYRSLYERLVANTVLSDPDNPRSCWLWIGSTAGDSDYPRVPVRVPGKQYPQNRAAHRVMLEELHCVEFPEDEAGHLCNNPRCVNPEHLEIQTPAMNSIERRYVVNPAQHLLKERMIPVLYPRWDHAANDPDLYAGERFASGDPCPF